MSDLDPAIATTHRVIGMWFGDDLPMHDIAKRVGIHQIDVLRICEAEAARRDQQVKSKKTPAQQAQLEQLHARKREKMLSSEQTARVIQLYRDGMLLKLIAHDVGRPYGSISYIIGKAIAAGLVKSRYRAVEDWERTPERLAAMAQDYRDGMPLKQIGEKYGREFKIILTWLKPFFDRGELTRRRPRLR